MSSADHPSRKSRWMYQINEDLHIGTDKRISISWREKTSITATETNKDITSTTWSGKLRQASIDGTVLATITDGSTEGAITYTTGTSGDFEIWIASENITAASTSTPVYLDFKVTFPSGDVVPFPGIFKFTVYDLSAN